MTIRNALWVSSVLAILFGATDCPAAEGLLFVVDKGDTYLYQPDHPTTLTQLNEGPPRLVRWGDIVIEASEYDPFHRKLYVTTLDIPQGMFTLDISRSKTKYLEIKNIEPGPGRRLLYDDQNKRLVTSAKEAHIKNNGTRLEDFVVTKRYFIGLGEDGQWHELDAKEVQDLTFEHMSMRTELVPGSLRTSKDLSADVSDLRALSKDFDETDQWTLTGRSKNLTVFLRKQMEKLKYGQAYRNTHFLIQDKLTKTRKMQIFPESASGLVYDKFVLFFEYPKALGGHWPTRSDNRTGDWQLYYSGAKEIFKTRLDPHLMVAAVDEEKDVVYFIEERTPLEERILLEGTSVPGYALYEVPVSVEGWGTPRKIAVLPFRPSWTFVVPEKP
jgi:hypothetical protein